MITAADAHEFVVARARGCCGDDSWRGRFCSYHEGFEDGLFEMLEQVEKAEGS